MAASDYTIELDFYSCPGGVTSCSFTKGVNQAVSNAPFTIAAPAASNNLRSTLNNFAIVLKAFTNFISTLGGWSR